MITKRNKKSIKSEKKLEELDQLVALLRFLILKLSIYTHMSQSPTSSQLRDIPPTPMSSRASASTPGSEYDILLPPSPGPLEPPGPGNAFTLITLKNLNTGASGMCVILFYLSPISIFKVCFFVSRCKRGEGVITSTFMRWPDLPRLSQIKLS